LRSGAARQRSKGARSNGSLNAVLFSRVVAGGLPLVAVDRAGSRKGRGESHAANLALAHRRGVDACQARTEKLQWPCACALGSRAQVGRHCRQRLVALLREASSRCCHALKAKKGVSQQAVALVLCPNAAAWGRARRFAQSSTRLCSALGRQHGSVLAL
jgi:hypothetical protein